MPQLTPTQVTLQRKVLKDITLPDGTLIPTGTLIGAASYPIHLDDALFPDANTFDPFRFARMREREGESTKHQFVSTSPEYIPFGHGQHAWCVLALPSPWFLGLSSRGAHNARALPVTLSVS